MQKNVIVTGGSRGLGLGIARTTYFVSMIGDSVFNRTSR